MGLEDRLFISDMRTPTTIPENPQVSNGNGMSVENTNTTGDNPVNENTQAVPTTAQSNINGSNLINNNNATPGAGAVYHGLPDQVTSTPSATTAASPTSPVAVAGYADSIPHRSPGDEPPRKRRRPALSCEPCRRRKVRCDRMQPCGPCVRMRVQVTCEYDNRVPRAGLPPGVNEFAVPRLGEYRPLHQTPEASSRAYAEFESEVLQHACPSTAQTSSIRDVSSHDHSAPESSKAASSSLAELLQTVRELQYRVSRTERVTSAHSNASYDDRPLQGQLQSLQQKVASLEERMVRAERSQSTNEHASEAADQHVTGLSGPLPAPRLRKGTSKVYGPTHYAHLFDAKDDAFGRMIAKQGRSKFSFAQDPQMVSALGLFQKVGSLRRSIKASRRVKSVDSICHSIESALRWNTQHGLINQYFDHLETIHRVLHRPTFDRRFQQHHNNIAKASIGLVVQILLVCAVGAVFVDESPELRSLAPKWVYSAQQWMTGPDEKAFEDETSVQNWCLLLIARQVHNVGTKEQTYTLAGSMLRAAFSLGLHRDPTRFGGMAFYSITMRRCIWSTVSELSLMASFDASRPALLCIDDFDAEPPSSINDGGMDENSQSSDFPALSDDSDSAMSLQRLLRTSFASRLEIAQMLHDIKQGISCKRAYEVIVHLQNILQRTQSYHGLPESKSLGLQLHNATIESTLLYLCCGILVNTRTDERFLLFHELALSVSESLISSTSVGQGSMHASPLSRLALHSTGCIFKPGFSLNALGVISQVLLDQLPTVSIAPTDPRHRLLIQLLGRKKAECLQIIRAGDPACKCYVFLHVTLAMIEAKREGRATPDAFPLALAEALETCAQELQKLAHDSGESAPNTNDVDVSMFEDIDFGSDPSWLLGVWNFGGLGDANART